MYEYTKNMPRCARGWDRIVPSPHYPCCSIHCTGIRWTATKGIEIALTVNSKYWQLLSAAIVSTDTPRVVTVPVGKSCQGFAECTRCESDYFCKATWWWWSSSSSSSSSSISSASRSVYMGVLVEPQTLVWENCFVWLSVAGLSPRTPGLYQDYPWGTFGTQSISWYGGFFRYLDFPLSLQLHQYFVLIFPSSTSDEWHRQQIITSYFPCIRYVSKNIMMLHNCRIPWIQTSVNCVYETSDRKSPNTSVVCCIICRNSKRDERVSSLH